MTQQGPVQSDFALIALLDALGTKGILSHAAPEGVVERWETLLGQLGAFADIAVGHPSCASCSMLAFSDTILVSMVPTSESTQPDCLSLIGAMLQESLWLGMEEGIFLRGALAAGRLIQASTRILGDAIEEAGSWFEIGDWMGVLTTPSTTRLIEQIRLEGADVSHLFVEHDVPVSRQPSVHTWAINWPGYAQGKQASAAIDLRRSFRVHSGPVPPEVRGKYDNTLAFAERVWNPQAPDATR